MNPFTLSRHWSLASWGALALLAFFGCSRAGRSNSTPEAVIWRIDSTSTINGLTPTVLGAPTVADVGPGNAVCFDGVDDGLVFGANPLAGKKAFTVEVSFRPDADGPAEQRFVHIQEAGSPNRAMIETRVASSAFYLDTFLASGSSKVTLVEPKLLHPTGRLYWAALSYEAGRMRHFIDGVEELSGALEFAPLGPGEMSLGVRLNRQYWFKGCIRELRFWSRALPANELQKSAAP